MNMKYGALSLCRAVGRCIVWKAKEINMTVSSHVTELKKKHANLSEKVEMTQRSPASDSLDIKSLKQEKLRLKQEIERLST